MTFGVRHHQGRDFGLLERKGAWERDFACLAKGDVMRGLRAEQSRSQQAEGCLIGDDRQTKVTSKA